MLRQPLIPSGLPIHLAALQRAKGLLTLDEEPSFASKKSSYGRFEHDPVGFCETYFRETYTDDIKEMMESVWRNRQTEAKSANQVGKTHGVARLGVAFYKIFPDAQVY